jgi:hypothetical protein
MKWRNADKALPLEDEKVLLWNKEGGYQIGYFTDYTADNVIMYLLTSHKPEWDRENANWYWAQLPTDPETMKAKRRRKNAIPGV